MHPIIGSALFSFLALATTGRAYARQETPATLPAPTPATAPQGSAVPPLADLLIPIHTQPADPAGGEYGWWAGADSYKCSFHDGFTFHPFVGPDVAESPSWSWRDTRAWVGEQQILAPGPSAAHAHAALRWEYRHAGITEAYDVRTDGVEQTFTVAERPAAGGDLVIRGEVRTRLHARPRTSEREAIVFEDEAGSARVVYGAAVAIDAVGRRTPVTTAFDGLGLTLTVDAATVAAATYPLTIDPLTAAALHTFSSLPHYELAIQSDGTSVIAYFSRQFSGSDQDGYAVLTGPDLSLATRTLLFSDITTAWSTRNGDVTVTQHVPPFVIGQWVVTYQRDLPAPQTRSTLGAYFHDVTSTTANSGATLALPSAAGVTQRYPHISGENSGFLLLVFQQDLTSSQQNTTNSEVLGQRIRIGHPPTLAGGSLTLDTLPVGTALDREFPAVSRTSGLGPWAVVWQERDVRQAGSFWRIYCAFVQTDGFTTGTASGGNFLGDPTAPVHQIRPRVDGLAFFGQNRFVATYLTGAPTDQSPAGTAIETHRFDFTFAWPLIRASIARHVVTTSTTANLTWPSIAFDRLGQSHWGISWQRGTFPTWQVFVARVGATGGVVEEATVYASATTGAYHPAICRVTAPTAGSVFAVLYATNENPTSMNPVYGRQFRYPTTAANTVYGNGCRGMIGANREPRAGDGAYEVLMTGGPSAQPAVLLMAIASASIPLAGIGLGPCFFNVDTVVASFPAVLDANGAARVPMPLSDAPVFIGDFYCQWFLLDPTAAWPMPAAFTPGLHIAVR